MNQTVCNECGEIFDAVKIIIQVGGHCVVLAVESVGVYGQALSDTRINKNADICYVCIEKALREKYGSN